METVHYRRWSPSWIDDEMDKIPDFSETKWDPDEEISDEEYNQWFYEHSSAMLKKYEECMDGLGDEGEVYAPENPYRKMSYELSEEFLDILERAGAEYHPADEMSVEEFDAWIYAQASAELKAFLDQIAKSDA